VRPQFGVRLVFILIGFTAVIAQIVLLRELMAVFYGNETSIGFMLASWLFWTAVGSSLAGPATARVREPRRLMAGMQVLVAAILPATVLAVRASKGLLQTVPGEVLGPGAMLLTSFCALGPLCLLSGALFTAGSRMAAAGAVYLWEAVGSSAGGLVAALLLVGHWNSLEIALLLAGLNLLAASMPRYAAMAGVVVISAVVAISGWPQRLESSSQERFWRGPPLVATRSSLYGSLAVVGTEGSRSVYENGVVLFNVPDPAAAEEAVHYALLEHPAPRSLLLIGGGVNGSIAQALRHPTLERVDYVELDPAILDLAREYFPNEWRALGEDPRVHIHVTDGRLFVKTTRLSFDVVIVNLPEPLNAQLNRFYTVEFFREVARRLTPTGLLSFQLRSSENYLSAELAQFLRTIDASLREVFPEVATIPGETVHFFATQRPGVLASGAGELLARSHARNLHASYVSEYFIPYRMTPDRMAELDAQLRPTASTPVNRDFAPVAYYFDAALWSSQFHRGYSRLFRAMAGVPFGAMAATLAVILTLLAVTGRRQLPFVAGFSTVATGFSMIGLEMLLLLGFQAVYGYLYQQLAVVIAAFMAGMALGSWLGMRPAARAGMRVLAITQFLCAAAPLLLLAIVQGPAVSRMAFPALAALSGMLGGYEFAVASRMVQRPGRLYALDLAGSCLAAILFSVWLVPVFGFFRTALLSAMVSLAPAALAMFADGGTDAAE
jgi:spermidine synthase